MLVAVKSPNQCSNEQLKLFEQCIVQGSEIESDLLMGKIKQAHRLLFAYEDQTFLGVGALRHASMDYCHRQRRQSSITRHF